MNPDRTAHRLENAFAHSLAAGDFGEVVGMVGAWVFIGEFHDADGETTLVCLHSADARTSIRLGMIEYARELACRDALDVTVDLESPQAPDVDR